MDMNGLVSKKVNFRLDLCKLAADTIDPSNADARNKNSVIQESSQILLVILTLVVNVHTAYARLLLNVLPLNP
jgi:hypothetical protein